MNGKDLLPLIESELRRTPDPSVVALAAQLAERAAGRVATVLFYGSALRTGSLDGILDYYIVLDDVGDWPGSFLGRLANRVLPPNVGYLEARIDHRVLRAKYAILSLTQFSLRMSMRSIDTTLWARFSQPCVAVFARSPESLTAVAGALCQAATTAAGWAACLGPDRGDAAQFWRALYARTYDAELRVEGAVRGAELVDGDSERYARLLPLAWRVSGIAFDVDPSGLLQPRLSARDRQSARRRWARRRRLGRLLNLLRLIKSAFTFDGAMDYVAWKVERHSGVRLEVRPWQRRHPLLAAPWLYWRLRRLNLLR